MCVMYAFVKHAQMQKATVKHSPVDAARLLCQGLSCDVGELKVGHAGTACHKSRMLESS